MLFSLKSALAGHRFVDLVVNPEHIAKTEEQLAHLVEGFEYDYQKYAQGKEAAQKDIRKLLAVIKKVERAGEAEVELKKDFLKYEKALQRQIKDILKIVRFLRQLIENEDLDLLHDVRAPLSAFEEFIRQLKESFCFALPKKQADEIRAALTAIDQAYEKLLETVRKYLENEFRFLSRTGYETNLIVGRDINLELYLKNRLTIKRKIQGKVLFIQGKLKQLTETLQKLKTARQLDPKYAQNLASNITYFSQQFSGLIEFSLQRVEIAKEVIMQGINLQKDYLNRLAEAKNAQKELYPQVLQAQESLFAAERSAYRREQLGKKVKLWKNKKEDFEKEITAIEKEAETYSFRMERVVRRTLSRERRQARTALRRFDRLRRKAGIALAALAAISTVTLASASIKKEKIISPPQAALVETVMPGAGAPSIEKPTFTFGGFERLLAKEQKDILPFQDEITSQGIHLQLYPGQKKLLVFTKSGKLLKEFKVRGGPQQITPDLSNPGHWYGPTPSGKFFIYKADIKPYVNRGSSWPYARLAFGALIRENKGEIEVSEDEGKTWFFVTGPQAKIGGLKKEDFYFLGQLMGNWWKNPFGHLTIKLRDSRGNIRPQMIHPNALLEKGLPMFLTPSSHGCMHIDSRDIDELARIINMAKGKAVPFEINPYQALARL